MINNKHEKDVEVYKESVLRALDGIKEASDSTKWEPQELVANSKNLPPYYLLYFLFVDLLKFKYQYQPIEKVAWEIPFDYKGKAYLISLAKFGLTITGYKREGKKILELINNAVNIAAPYYEYIAKNAISTNKINVLNKSIKLYGRYKYFSDKYTQSKNLSNKEKKKYPNGKQIGANQYELFPYMKYYPEMENLLFATIEAFFSYTEHIFVLLAVIFGKLKTGEEVLEFVKINWDEKYKKVLPLNIKENKAIYEKLLIIKRQLRNYLTHGSFGKEGEAFHFHSGTGAVPVFLNDYKNLSIALEAKKYEYIEKNTLKIMDDFIKYIWSGKRKNAKLLIQNTDLNLILTHINDGTYGKILKTKSDMEQFIEYSYYQLDNASNMDW